jgi:hypothetical protein
VVEGTEFARTIQASNQLPSVPFGLAGDVTFHRIPLDFACVFIKFRSISSVFLLENSTRSRSCPCRSFATISHCPVSVVAPFWKARAKTQAEWDSKAEPGGVYIDDPSKLVINAAPPMRSGLYTVWLVAEDVGGTAGARGLSVRFDQALLQTWQLNITGGPNFVVESYSRVPSADPAVVAGSAIGEVDCVVGTTLQIAPIDRARDHLFPLKFGSISPFVFFCFFFVLLGTPSDRLITPCGGLRCDQTSSLA